MVRGLILLCFLLSGCAYGNQDYFIGFGSREIEYHDNGKIKRVKIESKTPLENIVSVSAVK